MMRNSIDFYRHFQFGIPSLKFGFGLLSLCILVLSRSLILRSTASLWLLGANLVKSNNFCAHYRDHRGKYSGNDCLPDIVKSGPKESAFSSSSEILVCVP